MLHTWSVSSAAIAGISFSVPWTRQAPHDPSDVLDQAIRVAPSKEAHRTQDQVGDAATANEALDVGLFPCRVFRLDSGRGFVRPAGFRQLRGYGLLRLCTSVADVDSLFPERLRQDILRLALWEVDILQLRLE